MYKKLILIVGLTIIGLTACKDNDPPTQAEDVYTIISQPEITAGDPVPPPTDEVILTMTGKIGNHNVGDSLQFDMATLEQLGIVEYRVADKQAEEGMATFQGVLLSQLLNVAGIADDATTLHTIALNDYTVEIPLEDIETYPVLLATAVEGQRMTIERYGPTRIIYPYHAFDLDETLYDPRWIWQLATIDVQ